MMKVKIKHLALLLFKGRQIYPNVDKWTHERVLRLMPCVCSV